ncbi:MAG: hypothetical protein QM714_16140 [Nocardioides sp.]
MPIVSGLGFLGAGATNLDEAAELCSRFVWVDATGRIGSTAVRDRWD